MATATATDLLAVLRQSRLLHPAQLDELARLARKYGEPRKFSRKLVERGCLTTYQADLLQQGRGDDLVMEPYIVLDRLGEGKVGQIYKARHRNLDRTVTIKVLRKELLDDYDVLARFYREIRLVSQVNHPNIVHAYDAGPIGGQHMIVMEHVEGFDLGRLVGRRGPLPAGEACEYVRQAAIGLQHAHERGLVHRDLQPSNLLLMPPLRSGVPGSGSAVVKVLDLGLGRLLHKSAWDAGKSQLTMLGDGEMDFTDYTAPEQVLDFHGADIRADIYGLGATLFFLLTGRPPTLPGKPMERLLRLEHVELPALEPLCLNLPAGLAAVYRKMTACRSKDRYATPAEAAQALAPFCSDHTPPLAIPIASPVAAPTIRRHLAVVATAAVLLLLVASSLIFFLGRSKEPEAAKSLITWPRPAGTTPTPTATTPPLPGKGNRANPAGTWRWTANIGGDRTREYTLRLRLEGDRLAGVLNDAPIQDARYKDGELAFSLNFERGGQKITAKYNGRVNGDEIRGRSEWDVGGQQRNRDWEARRVKE